MNKKAALQKYSDGHINRVNENVYELTSSLWLDTEHINNCEDTSIIRETIIQLAIELAEIFEVEAYKANKDTIADYLECSYYVRIDQWYNDHKNQIIGVE